MTGRDATLDCERLGRQFFGSVKITLLRKYARQEMLHAERTEGVFRSENLCRALAGRRKQAARLINAVRGEEERGEIVDIGKGVGRVSQSGAGAPVDDIAHNRFGFDNIAAFGERLTEISQGDYEIQVVGSQDASANFKTLPINGFSFRILFLVY